MKKGHIFVLLILVFLSGCQRKTVVSGIDERQSTEVLLALHDAGISADREQQSAGRVTHYAVTVADNDYFAALQLLQEYRLPKKDELPLEELTQASGFMPTSAEMSALRMDHALGAEIERLVSRFPGVIEARAIIRSTFRIQRSFRNTGEEPTATLLVRYVSSTDWPPTRELEIRDIVAKAVPGMRAEQVNLTLAPIGLSADRKSKIVEPTELSASGKRLEPFSFRVASEEHSQAQVELMTIMLLAVGCSLIIGAYLGWRWSTMARLAQHRKNVRRETTVLSNAYLLDAALRAPSSGKDKSESRPGDVTTKGNPSPKT